MFTLWYLYKGYEEFRSFNFKQKKHLEKLKLPVITADSTPGKTVPQPSTPTVTPATPTPITPTPPSIPAPQKQPLAPVPEKQPPPPPPPQKQPSSIPEKQPSPNPTPEKSSPIQIPEKKQEDLRPKNKEDLKLSEGLPKSVISPIDDEDLLLTRQKLPEQRPRAPQAEERKTISATTPVKEQPQWQPILKPEEPKKPAPVTIPQWDSFPKPNTPKRDDFASFERGQETLSRGAEGNVSKGPQQEFYQRKKEYLDSSEEEVEEEDEDTDKEF